MKKWIFGLLILIVLAITLAYCLIFDEKDRCLDYGGSYNQATQQCEK